ncbi:30S ribosomal protein S15, partial [Prevotella sp.]|uniref:30S ribosomal protein S15 n=1 Tax=Prevotella sp. TaxID=59823 RepID=UPI00307C4F69
QRPCSSMIFTVLLQVLRKDHTTARSLTKMVGKRRALLDYLYDRDINRYRAIIKALGLRR